MTSRRAKRAPATKKAPRAKAKPTDMNVSAKRLALIFGLESERQVQRLSRDDGMPKAKHGRYPVIQCCAWFIARARENGFAPGPKAPPELKDARLRRELAQAERAEIDLARIKGEIIDRAEYERELSSITTELSARLEAVPPRHAARFLNISDEMIAVQRLTEVTLEVRAALRTTATAPAE